MTKNAIALLLICLSTAYGCVPAAYVGADVPVPADCEGLIARAVTSGDAVADRLLFCQNQMLLQKVEEQKREAAARVRKGQFRERIAAVIGIALLAAHHTNNR